MGRGRKRRDDTASMEKPKRVKISDEQLLDKGRDLVAKLTALRAVRRELRDASSNAKGRIKTLEAEVEALRDEIASGYELRPQGDLFAQDLEAPTKEQATEALAHVAEVAGDQPEPQQQADDPIGRHVFMPDEDTNAPEDSRPCRMCGRGDGDELHRVSEADEPKSEDEPRPQRHSETLERCPACAAGTCTVHKHRFVEGGEPENRCAGCGKAQRARIHQVDGDDTYDFDGSEPPPKIIRTHRAVDTTDADRPTLADA